MKHHEGNCASSEQRLQERLRTNEERRGYLQAALDAVENYSPKDELAALCLVVQDVIKSLQPAEPGFDIYAGMTGRDFEFKGADKGKGATFQHKPCGFVIRLAPGMTIGNIADMISEHDCKTDAAYDAAMSETNQGDETR